MDENLLYFERKFFSQNAEDGVIARIFELVGTTNRQYLEFGAGDGHENLTRNLQVNHGFAGNRWDGAHNSLEFQVRKEFVTAENIADLCDKYVVPKMIDFLSIDIDGNDWHVWRAIQPRVSARVIAIEFNPSWPPPEDCVLPYDPNFCWTGSCRYGASIQAYYNLGRYLGYTLVYQESRSINLFFVKDTVLAEKGIRFKNQNEPAKLYLAPYSTLGGRDGHGPDDRTDYASSEDLLIS